MNSTETSLDVLNDLIRINNDRVNGFTKVIEKLSPKDQDLKTIFQQYVSQSQQFSQQLTAEASKDRNYSPHNEGTSVSGSLHRTWIDVKSMFDNDRQSLLQEAERGEDSIIKSYKDALSSNLDQRQSMIVQDQYSQIRKSHDKIRSMRDQPELETI